MQARAPGDLRDGQCGLLRRERLEVPHSPRQNRLAVLCPHLAIIGLPPGRRLNAFRDHLDAGLAIAAGMDWGPTNSFEQMQLAVTHQMFPSGRTNAGPAQVVSRTEAFEMWTANGAQLLGWDGIGTLVPGHHADLAIVDRNPITCAIDALPATRVLRTHVSGRVVHDDGTLPALS
jgi:predicted amidohydrolase YtcJ